MTAPTRILVADDDDDTRTMMALLIASAGFRVTEVCNGQEAVEELQTTAQSHFVALLDVRMPVRDGISAAAVIRQCWPWIDIVFHTSMEEDWVQERFDDYHAWFRKPADWAALSATLTDLSKRVSGAT